MPMHEGRTRRKGAAALLPALTLSLFLVPAAALGAPTLIADGTPSSAVNDGVINPGEYVGFSGGINAGFGDVIGASSQLFVDSATDGTLNIGLQTGPGSLNDAVVIYVDAVPGGFADTSGFSDVADPLRRAISGTDGTNRSVLTFAPGFEADYAIAFDATFAGVWSLDTVSHVFVADAGLQGGAGQWEMQLDLADLGLTPGLPFSYVATYLNSGNAFRSDEFHGVAASTVSGGNPGQGPVTLVDGDSNVFQSAEPPVATESAAFGAIKALYR